MSEQMTTTVVDLESVKESVTEAYLTKLVADNGGKVTVSWKDRQGVVHTRELAEGDTKGARGSFVHQRRTAWGLIDHTTPKGTVVGKTYVPPKTTPTTVEFDGGVAIIGLDLGVYVRYDPKTDTVAIPRMQLGRVKDYTAKLNAITADPKAVIQGATPKPDYRLGNYATPEVDYTLACEAILTMAFKAHDFKFLAKHGDALANAKPGLLSSKQTDVAAWLAKNMPEPEPTETE